MSGDRKLVVSPQAGMCNRFRALASAIVLANYLNRELYYCWFPSVSGIDHVKAIEKRELGDLFETTPEGSLISGRPEEAPIHRYTGQFPISIVFTEWLPEHFWYQSNAQETYANSVAKLQINADASLLKQVDLPVIFLETSLEVYLPEYASRLDQLMHQAYQKLIPKQVYTDVIKDFRSEHVTISIRRGDLLDYFPEANQSYEDILRWAQRLFPQRLVIFSDDYEFRDRLRKELGTECNPRFELLKEQGLNPGFIEFLFMATKSFHIYGTPHSSFSKQAAVYGGVGFGLVLS